MQTKCDRIVRFPRVVNAYRLPWKDYFTCSSCLSYHVPAPKENDDRKESAHPFFLCLIKINPLFLRRQSKKLDNKAEEQYTESIQNVSSLKEHSRRGQATRTTTLYLNRCYR